jgi:hypothetical protein
MYELKEKMNLFYIQANMTPTWCCGGNDPDEAFARSITDKKRKCTDFLFCVLFILFWAGMVVAVLGFQDGETNK